MPKTYKALGDLAPEVLTSYITSCKQLLTLPYSPPGLNSAIANATLSPRLLEGTDFKTCHSVYDQ